MLLRAFTAACHVCCRHHASLQCSRQERRLAPLGYDDTAGAYALCTSLPREKRVPSCAFYDEAKKAASSL